MGTGRPAAPIRTDKRRVGSYRVLLGALGITNSMRLPQGGASGFLKATPIVCPTAASAEPASLRAFLGEVTSVQV